MVIFIWCSALLSWLSEIGLTCVTMCMNSGIVYACGCVVVYEVASKFCVSGFLYCCVYDDVSVCVFLALTV